jgi:hypothetical protein
MAEQRLCPAAGCAAVQQPGKFMCLSHWRRTPKPLRDEVWRTYRVVLGHRRSRDTPEQMLANIRDYRAACDAATAYWAD